MCDMFKNYDEIPEGYIPVNTHWPEVPKQVPCAILVTPSRGYEDTFPIRFLISKELVSRLPNSTLELVIDTFRGEEVLKLSAPLEEAAEFKLSEEGRKKLVPDVYYLTLVVTTEESEQYTLHDKTCKCLFVS